MADNMSITWYDLEHRGIRCVGVDWERKVFYLDDGHSRITYQPSLQLEYTVSDLDFIKDVIDLYLREKETAISKANTEQQLPTDMAKTIVSVFWESLREIVQEFHAEEKQTQSSNKESSLESKMEKLIYECLDEIIKEHDAKKSK